MSEPLDLDAIEARLNACRNPETYASEDAAKAHLLEVDVPALVAEVRRLRDALEAEWRKNHDEHCGNMDDCESFVTGGRTCYGPRPEALGAADR